MTRSTGAVATRRRHKKILNRAKGYYGARSRTFRSAHQAVIRAGQYAFRDRRRLKRDMRALWVARINAAARMHGLSYSRFIHGLCLADIRVDRKVLADISVHEPDLFGQLAHKSAQSLPS
ncbi:MAG: 50S ribosomal protein L20 [Gammaproteobacteria bacterium]|nr:50S ribosomal protein L20 [Pseudomonadota bacterium]MCH9662892.1 50S ribosomal protein L20 [Gammaproteobacteria bacterium]